MESEIPEMEKEIIWWHLKVLFSRHSDFLTLLTLSQVLYKLIVAFIKVLIT